MKVFKLCVSSFLLGACGACILTCLLDAAAVSAVDYVDKEKYDDDFADKLFQIDLADNN